MILLQSQLNCLFTEGIWRHIHMRHWSVLFAVFYEALKAFTHC